MTLPLLTVKYLFRFRGRSIVGISSEFIFFIRVPRWTWWYRKTTPSETRQRNCFRDLVSCAQGRGIRKEQCHFKWSFFLTWVSNSDFYRKRITITHKLVNMQGRRKLCAKLSSAFLRKWCKTTSVPFLLFAIREFLTRAIDWSLTIHN